LPNHSLATNHLYHRHHQSGPSAIIHGQANLRFFRCFSRCRRFRRQSNRFCSRPFSRNGPQDPISPHPIERVLPDAALIRRLTIRET